MKQRENVLMSYGVLTHNPKAALVENSFSLLRLCSYPMCPKMTPNSASFSSDGPQPHGSRELHSRWPRDFAGEASWHQQSKASTPLSLAPHLRFVPGSSKLLLNPMPA